MADVVVIGAGVSGLAAADHLARLGRDVLVLERQHRTGGNAISDRFGGFLMERGPSTVNAQSAAALELSNDLGLAAERCDLGARIQHRYLVKDGRLSGIPVHPLGMFTSDYLSRRARLRLLAEVLLPRRRESGEETVRAFCVRRFGREFSDRIMDPLVGGLYAGCADELSVDAVFPRLQAFEQRFGSVTLGALNGRRQERRMPGSRLFSWRDGIATLPAALTRRLGHRVRTGMAVRRVVRDGTRYRIEAGDGATLLSHAVVLATQPHFAAQLLERLDPAAAEAAGGIAAPPLAVVFLGYRREQVAHPLDGLGFLAPRGEGRALSGAQFCSTMFPGRAPEGCVALAGYFGGARAPEVGRLPGRELIVLARREFAELLGAAGAPVVARTAHWPLGLPQYRLGHPARVAQLRSLDQRLPGLFLTGNYLAGPSVADCLAVAAGVGEAVERFLSGSLPRAAAAPRRQTLRA